MAIRLFIIVFFALIVGGAAGTLRAAGWAPLSYLAAAIVMGFVIAGAAVSRPRRNGARPRLVRP